MWYNTNTPSVKHLAYSNQLASKDCKMDTSNNTSDIPYGYCQCGCGQKTLPLDRTDPKRGYVKGEPAKFLKLHYKSPRHTEDQSIAAFWSKVSITANDDLCWLWQGSLNSDGYGNASYKHRILGAHRIAWMIPNYVIPDGMEVCHSCDNPSCVNPKHLFIGTHQDNLKDMEAKDRRAKGIQVKHHKLTPETVSEARTKYAAGNVTIASLAREYGVKHGTMTCALKGITWKQ